MSVYATLWRLEFPRYGTITRGVIGSRSPLKERQQWISIFCDTPN